MKTQDRVTGAIFILIGIAVVIYSFTVLSLGIIKQPGPGFFPFICGWLMIVFTLVWWILASRTKSTDDSSFWEKGTWMKPLLAVILICIYGSIMEGLGYVLSTFIFVMLWQMVLEREKLIKSIIMSVIGSAVMFALFTFLLQVPLPKGIFY